mmetsp:Transcript_19005/g.54763  ORF Transcript_19005/g.54763 Transcript_19005/m.54763 type:complete len:286 (+) Transcript_19005:96-953(+)
MPRSTRSRQAVKRTVLGAVNDDTADAGAIVGKAVTAAASSAASTVSNANSNSVEIPTSGIDGTSRAQIDLLLQDLESEVQSRIDGIAERASQGVEEQREAAFLAGIRLDRTAKKMTIGDFNAKFGCDIVADVMAIVKAGGAAEAGKKRIRPVDVASAASSGIGNPLETPAPKSRGAAQQAPETILRTVRRGEAVFSANGSPVEHSEEGSLVATVAKKRRDRTNGGGADDEVTGAAFDINVGDGRYISLSDPNTIDHLDDNMKNAAMNQLKILQDQMASLMAQLDK